MYVINLELMRTRLAIKSKRISVYIFFRKLNKYQKLRVKYLLDKETFWKTIKPYFKDKGFNSNEPSNNELPN